MKDCPWEKFKEKDRVSFSSKSVRRSLPEILRFNDGYFIKFGNRHMHCHMAELANSDQDKARTGRVQKN